MDSFEDGLRELYASRQVAYSEKRFHDFEKELQRLLEGAKDIEYRFSLYCLLAEHYHLLNDDELALSAIRASIDVCPDRVEAWLGLAEHYHYHDVDLTLAAQNIEVALQKAIAENAQVRQVLGVRIRIALAQRAYDLVNDSLAKLVDYQVPKGGFDVALEDDFLAKIPVDAVDERILAQYKGLPRRKIQSGIGGSS